jgi:hypothetical protein
MAAELLLTRKAWGGKGRQELEREAYLQNRVSGWDRVSGVGMFVFLHVETSGSN